MQSLTTTSGVRGRGDGLAFIGHLLNARHITCNFVSSSQQSHTAAIIPIIHQWKLRRREV